MKRLSILVQAITVAIGGLSFVQGAVADDDETVINGAFARIPATEASGSGHFVADQCGDFYEAATATLKVEQEGGTSQVKIKVRDAAPNTVYSVWLRLTGRDANGNSFGASPLTGGGATPLAPGSSLNDLMSYSPPNAGTSMPTNGFTTDANGNANWTVGLDFPLVGGAYPFNLAGAAPVAIVNPAAPGVSGPFMLRIISHCQDGLAHGLSPAQREAWFDWPI